MNNFEEAMKRITEHLKRPHRSRGECQLNSDMKQCCCVCEWHIEDHYHCITAVRLRDEVERMINDSRCICGMIRGWICLAPGFSDKEKKIAFSDWPEHSIGCEMFSDKRKK